MFSAISLITALLLAPADDLKPESPPPAVKEALDTYLKAVAAKDLDAMAKVADVPWLDRDRKLVRNRDELRKGLERVAAQLPPSKGERKVVTVSYKKVRDKIEDKAERKLLDELLGEDGWFVEVVEDGYPLSMRNILIRVKDRKASVVAGPLKQNQFVPQNQIPELVERLLKKTETFELYSLDPDRKVGKDPKVAKDDFWGTALGKTAVKAEADRKRLADALRLGAEDNFGVVALCFNPRHGIRLKDGDKTVDLVICFECLSIQVYVNGKPEKGFLTTDEPQEAFDAVLKAARVKLPKQAKE